MPRLTIVEYATLSVRLANIGAGAPPGSDASRDLGASLVGLLQEIGLTTEEWDAEVDHWEEALSQALDHDDEVPQLVLDYSRAVQAAQGALASPIGLETFSQVLGEVQRGTPLDQALRQRHISLPDFLSAQRHWMERAAAEPEVRLALEAKLR